MGIVVGIVPARGGSKRIPNKNMAPCGGLPLLGHTFAAARSARSLDRVILSTDDARIADYGREQGIEVPFLRPAALALDSAPMLDVLQHILHWLERETTAGIDALVLLQATSPLRTSEDIDNAVATFKEHPEADSVVSVTPIAHIFHPWKALTLAEGRLVPFMGDTGVAGTRDLPPAFGRNGPAVLVMRPATVRAGKIYGAVSLPYMMAPGSSIDIDEPFDLEVADLLLRKRQAQ